MSKFANVTKSKPCDVQLCIVFVTPINIHEWLECYHWVEWEKGGKVGKISGGSRIVQLGG